jgi:hypothetical protein
MRERAALVGAAAGSASRSILRGLRERVLGVDTSVSVVGLVRDGLVLVGDRAWFDRAARS